MGNLAVRAVVSGRVTKVQLGKWAQPATGILPGKERQLVFGTKPVFQVVVVRNSLG